jgi:hypothetical protein
MAKSIKKLEPLETKFPQPFYVIKNTKFKNKNLSPQVERRKINFNSKINGIMKTMTFEELLLEAIDDGLSLLGETGKQAVYCHLETHFKIKSPDIPSKIEEFTDAIERIFGNGAKILEIKIMQCLFKKGGYTLKNYSKQQNLTFIEYIVAAKLANLNHRNREEFQLNTESRQSGQNKIICTQMR